MDSAFPTTKYSLIAQLRSSNPAARKSALDLFVVGYRRALLRFLTVNKRIDQDDAEDIVHNFIVEKIMSGKVVSSSQKNGKFRNLLRKSLQNYLIDLIRKRKTNQKNFDSNSGLFAIENINNEFDSFDVLWAKGVFTAVLKQMETSSPYWEVFKARILTTPRMSYSEIVKRCGFDNPVKASNALMTAKRTFMRLIAETISESPDFVDENGIDDEIRMLKRILLNSSDVADLLSSLDSIYSPVGDLRELSEGNSGHLIARELGPIVDAAWTNAEIESMLQHLFATKIQDILGELSPLADHAIDDLLFQNSIDTENQLDVTLKLKRHFKLSNDTGDSSLPQPILVTIIFALIARYLQLGGEVAGITSISVEDLKIRLESIAKKPWIGSHLKTLFGLPLSQ